MTYNITKSDGSNLVALPDMVLDNLTTSITLVGKDAVNYGEEFSQNFIDLLQRFSNASAPVNPLPGQLWFDQEVYKLKVFNGTNWKIVSPAFDGYSGTVNLRLDSTPTTDISLVIGDQNIISVTSYNQVKQIYLPGNVVVDGITYELGDLFPNGLEPGVNLASPTAVTYRLNGQATSGNVLSTARTIGLVGGVHGSVSFDGSSNVNIHAGFSNVYVGNTNVTVAGVYSNVTVLSNGVIQTTSNISTGDIVAALGYLPYNDSNVNTASVGNTVVLRDQFGSFAANVMTGTASYTQKFTSNTTVSVNGALVGTSANFNGTANIVVMSNLVSTSSNLAAGVYNSVTVDENGYVTEGVLTQNMPVGAIVLYNNSVVIPEGWAKCNGANVVTPQGATITTPNLSNVLVGSSFYIMKAWSDLDLPSNDTIVGTISVNLQGNGAPTIYLVGGPNLPYPPLVWSNVNVGASGSTLSTNLVLKIHKATCKHKGKGYRIGDKLYVDMPNFDKKKSKKACIRVDSIETDGGIKTYTLIYQGNYYTVPESGINGIWITLTNYSQPTPMPNNQGYLPTGKVPNKRVWDGLPGFRKNKPKRDDNDKDDDDNIAEFDLDGTTESNSFTVQDVDFGDDLFFDATALVLTNGDPNSVMLSQTNLYGDLSNLTVAHVMKNLETRINSGLPPRLGKYMLSYDDIIHHAGYLKCPVDITKFTIAFQNQIMLLTTSDNANRFAYAGIFPSDDKLFGAAYIGFERYKALLTSNKALKVSEALEVAGLEKTKLPQIDDVIVSDFLYYISRLITNAKIAVANNRVAIKSAELANKYNKNKIPIPDPIIPTPLLTTGNVSVIMSETTIDGLPAVIGGDRGTPTYGGGSFQAAGTDVNKKTYTDINRIRYGISSDRGGDNQYGIKPDGSPSYSTGTGTNLGVTPSVNPSSGTGTTSFQVGNGMLGAYAQAESAGKIQWNSNGAANFKATYGYSLPDPATLSVGEVKSYQAMMIEANSRPGALPNASSAVGLVQQTKANLIEAQATASIPDTANFADAQAALANGAFTNAARSVASQLGKTPEQVTQSEVTMALSYGAGAAASILKAAETNPNQTLGQFAAANPQYSAASLLNNPPCTPQGFATPIGTISSSCSAFHNIPAPNASAIATQSTTVVGVGLGLATALSPAQPLTDQISVALTVTQTQLTAVNTELSKVPLSAQASSEIGAGLRAQGVQTNLGNGGSGGGGSSTVGGLSASQQAAISAGPGAYGSSQRAAYNAATGRGGSPVVGGADPALSRVSGGGGGGTLTSPGSPNTTGNNRGTNSTGTGPGNEVGSSSGAGPYSNGGGSGSSFNSGGSTTSRSSGTGYDSSGTPVNNSTSFGGPR